MTTHGHAGRKTRSGTYHSWYAMLNRCDNRNSYQQKNITVDPHWRVFQHFLEDMGERPDNLSLDRIDNNKGYYKENCRWATASVQQRNKGKHKNNKSGLSGVHWYKTYWIAKGCLNRVHVHLYCGKDFLGACCARKSWEIKCGT